MVDSEWEIEGVSNAKQCQIVAPPLFKFAELMINYHNSELAIRMKHIQS